MSEYTIAVMGNANVGKSSVVARIVGDGFVERYHRTIEDLYYKQFVLFNKIFRIKILDTAGSRQDRKFSLPTLKLADGFIIVISVDDEKSLTDVQTLINEVREVKGKEDVPMIFLANKSDLEWSFDWTLIPKYLKPDLVIEVSAKTNEGIDGIMKAMVNEVRKREPKKRSCFHKHCHFM